MPRRAAFVCYFGEKFRLKGEGRPEDVYDFSFAKRAHEEIKAEGWDAKKYHHVGKK
jgi:hypothetical protein